MCARKRRNLFFPFGICPPLRRNYACEIRPVVAEWPLAGGQKKKKDQYGNLSKIERTFSVNK
jgi:hypothetical protein